LGMVLGYLEQGANGAAAWALRDLAKAVPDGSIKDKMLSLADDFSSYYTGESMTAGEETARYYRDELNRIGDEIEGKYKGVPLWILQQMPSAGNMLFGAGLSGIAGVNNLVTLGLTSGGNSALEAKDKGASDAQALAYGVVAPFFVAAGGVMALAMFVRTGVYESDPTNMLSYLCGSGFALLSLLLVAFANVGTQGTGSYVNCMIVKSGMPKVSYKVLVLIAMVYVSALTVWGGVEEHFGAFISIAAFIQAPIIGMIVVDYLVVKKRKLSLKAAYFIEGHDAYRFTGGFNLVGIGCVILSCLITILFVYNPLTGSIQSPLFLIFTGSGFDAICGGLLYWLASLTPLKKYMLRDRDDLEIV
jgi:cytosine/uracil/thiamine/allantoin permease